MRGNAARTLPRQAIAEERILVLIGQRITPGAGIKLIRRAMKLVGTRFGDIVHHRAHVVAVLCTAVVRDYLDFGQSIWIVEEDLRSGDRVVVVIRTVQLKVVRAAAVTVRREVGAIGVGK